MAQIAHLTHSTWKFMQKKLDGWSANRLFAIDDRICHFEPCIVAMIKIAD